VKGSYLIGRLLSAIPTILLVTFFVFIAIHLVPGDIVDIIQGTQNFLTPQQMEDLYRQYSLDKPVPIQYMIWLGNVLKLDMGISMRSGQSVAQLLVEKIPVTFQLSIMALGLSLLIGIPLGITSAIKRNSPLDHSVRFFGLVGLSAPSFWVGALLIVWVSSTVQNFTIFGYVPFHHNPVQNLQVMFLPSITLGLMIAAQILRMARTSMLDVMSQEYIKVAKAKGAKNRKVIFHHALRNALIPVTTTAGIQLGFLFGGTIITESMFALPGMGRMLLQAVNERDYPLVQGVVLFIAVVIVLLNIAVDILYTFIDPRIELS